MKTLGFLLEKEFRQLLRNRQLLRTLLLAPLIQLIILPLAADYTVKNIGIAVADNDHSTTSLRLIEKIVSSGYFKLQGYTASYHDALGMVEADKADLALQIPAHFESDLVREDKKQVYVAINAIEGTKANLGGAYLNSIISDFNENVRAQWQVGSASTGSPEEAPQVSVASSNWYNIFLNYHLYMVPAILVTLVTAMVAMQSAFNIVQEKESGTIEQINVTPIKKHIFIIGKMVPFMVLGIVLFTMGLLVGWIGYGIVPLGSLWVLYVSLIVYLFSMLGLGLLIATYSGTQQQAMSLSFFFINIFNMMSGVFTAVDSMPAWAQAIVTTFPPSHFIKIMRAVVLKGSGFSDILPWLGALAVIGIVLNGWAVLNYRKTS
ncbi:ABC transporter permease [Puia dinghuensis]|uniref:ABC transporter permease n=1 Tax=Puia dinghuensis TaxID=1792502 RepID=A0A8J2XVU9_9BACT|nr:ABC transporter permease [Puia dinghuensis]GGB21293.1 ABC transporter permease [Puia dinghuensis]